ncbi:uncharacterized protein AMSG_00258 [Thecamonas trahens ATCC 50062]|uniref:F-box domain-containing protein n=1 Tax=Thecamonas trahens ATCC 50062 TaxID=461836 RepID=A0A0L0D1Z6_THETB|nr:hypothetical protein AMSG_00258 [Thecamonas trahens ATCC 50062]KNC46140.1 hypothetical protein AMSG_00258 [Thecamonas trahens ATCC 50062]|eukprot:XP_013763117.1 hypothetical protein AMSG_00258 [Thecamonas trahens ATCC 50062]
MLESLPTELVLLVLEWCGPVEVARVGRTCSRLRAIARDALLWGRILQGMIPRATGVAVDAELGPLDELCGSMVRARRRAWYYGMLRSGGRKPAMYADEIDDDDEVLRLADAHTNVVGTARLGSISHVEVVGRQVVLGAEAVHVADLDTGKCRKVGAHFSEMNSMALWGDEGVVSAGADGRVCFTVLGSDDGPSHGWSAACSDDWLRRVVPVGGRAVASSRAKELFVLDAETGAVTDATAQLDSMAWTLAEFEPQTVACGSADGTVAVWDLRASLAQGPAAVAKVCSDMVSCLVEMENGCVVAGGFDGSLVTLDPRALTAGPCAVLRSHSARVLQVEAYAGGVISCAADCSLLRWDGESTRPSVGFETPGARGWQADDGDEGVGAAAMASSRPLFAQAFAVAADAGVVVANAANSPQVGVYSAATGHLLHKVGSRGPMARTTLPAANDDVLVTVTSMFVVAYDVAGMVAESVLGVK